MHVLLMILLSFAFSGFFDSEVNYWEKEQEKREKPKEDYYQKIWEETKNWFPQNVSPIERELYKNPTDPVLQRMYVKYIEERTQRARIIGNILKEHLRNKWKVLETIGKSGTVFYYFYSPNCPYCLMSDDTANKMSYYVKIVKINVDVPNPKTLELIEKFSVRATPTLVALRNNEVLGIWEGAFTWDNLYFLNWLEDIAVKVRRND